MVSRYGRILDLFKQKVLSKDARILNLGCGNSKLARDLFSLGYTNLVNVDYSAVVIDRMKQKHPDMTWMVMDVRALNIDDGTFDVVLDKGTMDAIQADKGSDTLDDDLDKMIKETIRVLKPSGLFFQITWEQAYFRKAITMKPEYRWTMKYEHVTGEQDDIYLWYTYVKL